MQLLNLRTAALLAGCVLAIGCSDEREVKAPAVAASPLFKP